ncbi:MAG: S9 family peptidase [Sphingomonadales bacterium]|jgi:acylaminoacyl-peptidase
MLRRLFVSIITLCLFSVQAIGEDLSKLELKDVFEMEYAADPQISPDGQTIVYVRQSMDIMSDQARANLWVLDVRSGEHRPLLSGTANYSMPRWSPDGKRLAYVSAVDRGAQIYVRWMDSGETARVTNLTQAPSSISFSPDGKQIAFSAFVEKSKEPLAKLPSAPEGAKWAKPAKVVEEMIYRIDGAGYLDVGFEHIFIVPADGGTARQLTSGDFDHGGPLSFSPDGKTLYFAANRHEDHLLDPNDSEVFALNIEDQSLTQLTTRQGPDFSPQISPNGRQIAYLGFDDEYQGYQLADLYVMDADGSDVELVSEDFDRSIGNPRWRSDGRAIIFLYDDEGKTKLAQMDLNGRVTDLSDDVGGNSLGRPYTSGSFSISENGAVAFTHDDAYRPGDVGYKPRRGDARILTDLNTDLLGHRTLGQVEKFWVESSHDGKKIQAWMVTPPGFDPEKKYPLILEIHGGPFAAYGPHFSAEVQLYAAAGYVVVYANPRGSTSYGAEFGNAIHHAYPSHDYDDLMSVVDEAIAKGFVDDKQLYVTGGSGGGVLTAWIVGKTDRFKAAVVAKPVINWTSFVLTSDFTNFFYKYWFPDFPWNAPEHYWARSPLSLVGNVSTPTMLLGGESDWRTPIWESEQFYQALKLRGVDTAMVRIPEASHGIAGRPSQLISKVAHILAWFEKYGDGAAE